jgi:hypothetical protein
MPIPKKIHKITKRLQMPEDVEKYFPWFLPFIDCIEQQMPRHESKRRKAYYSGKIKKHTVKTQLMVTNTVS